MLIAIKSNIVEEVVFLRFIWSFIGFCGTHVDPRKNIPKCTMAPTSNYNSMSVHKDHTCTLRFYFASILIYMHFYSKHAL